MRDGLGSGWLRRVHAGRRELAEAMAQAVGVSQVIHPGRRAIRMLATRSPSDAMSARSHADPRLGRWDARAHQVLRRLEVLIEATSLGGVESSPASRSTRRFNMTPQERLDT